MNSKLRTSVKEVQVPTCCPGYAETPARQCAPICLNACHNGRCTEPNFCQCMPEPTESSPGFVGSTCGRFVCLGDKWGSKCDRDCEICPVNSYCSASTGKCMCRSGWRGINCTEECDSTMNCEGLELPPIFEPEANVIDDTIPISGPASAKLQGRSLEHDILESENAKSIASLIAAHMGVNLFLTLLTFVLIFAVVRYRKEISRLKNDYYFYARPPPPNGSSGSSEYSADSTYTTYQNGTTRTRTLGPADSDFLGKNLNFNTATRFLVKSQNAGVNQSGELDRIVYNPKVEAHLISSKRNATENIYSDIESNLGDKPPSYTLIPASQTYNQATQQQRPLGVHTNLGPLPEDDDHYKSPKPSRQLALPEVPSDSQPQDTSTANNTTDASDAYFEGEQNIYDEIRPR